MGKDKIDPAYPLFGYAAQSRSSSCESQGWTDKPTDPLLDRLYKIKYRQMKIRSEAENKISIIDGLIQVLGG